MDSLKLGTKKKEEKKEERMECSRPDSFVVFNGRQKSYC